MAATERNQPERRRFITRHHVEDAAAAGQPIRVQGRDVVTDEAAQRATDLGVRIERDRVAGTASGSAGMSPALMGQSKAAPDARPESDADLRRAVRTAVVAELGVEHPGLDAVIDRVLKSRAR